MYLCEIKASLVCRELQDSRGKVKRTFLEKEDEEEEDEKGGREAGREGRQANMVVLGAVGEGRANGLQKVRVLRHNSPS